MKLFIQSLKMFLLLTILSGMVYPLVVTGLAQVIFPGKANGSMLWRNGRAVGSALIGQAFDSAGYFFSRPSAVSYNPLPSGGSNFGLTNAKLKQAAGERRQSFILKNHLDSMTIVPSEMLFASASGLDPHITVKAALLQVNRVSTERKFTPAQKLKLLQLIKDQTEAPQFLCLGEERINVLLLNLGVDTIQ